MTQIHRSSLDIEAGFTLLEVLVSMTLLALLSIALYESLTAGTRIWSVSERAAEETNRIRIAQSELSRLIETAYPEVDSNGNAAFEGHANSLRFLAPGDAVLGALSDVEIDKENEGEKSALVRSDTLELAAAPRAPRQRSVLLPNISALDIAYYGKPDANTPPAWSETWTNRLTLPEMVRIRVLFADPRARPWPDLIVSPRVAAAVNCTYDALAKTCQGR